MFRSSNYVSKEDYITYTSNAGINDNVGANALQNKENIRFTMSNGNAVHDWYKAYFLVSFRFVKPDNTFVAATDNSAPINGSFSLIRSLSVSTSLKNLFNINEIHRPCFIKNLLNYSDDFSRSSGNRFYWYLDKVDDYKTEVKDANLNTGAIQRGAAVYGKTFTVEIPLNNYSFFESLYDQPLPPPMQLMLDVKLQDDKELIWQGNTTANKVIVSDVTLRVPQLTFTAEGQELINKMYVIPTQKISFLQESHQKFVAARSEGQTVKISSGVIDAKHVFIYFQKVGRVNSYTENPYIFDTFDLGSNNAKLTSCQLKYGSKFYPHQSYNNIDSKEDRVVYRDVLGYNFRQFDTNTGNQLNTENFKTLYPFLYFDLRNYKDSGVSDNRDIQFTYSLNKTPDVDYNVVAIVLRSVSIETKIIGNQLVFA